MEQSDFDELMQSIRQVAAHLATTYREVTGEELDLESAIRHYPLVALGLAAGAGAVGGWFIGRRGRKDLPQLPPPPAPAATSPLEAIERFIPEGLERVRELIPDTIAEEAAEQARVWVEGVLEPKLREGVENAVTSLSETRWGAFFKETVRRFESGPDKELDDPE